jgi:hypothetical protein
MRGVGSSVAGGERPCSPPVARSNLPWSERDLARLLGQGLVARDRPASPCLVHPLPEGLKIGCYQEEGLIYTATDRSGQPLTFTTPADLARLRVPDDIDPWNRAVLAFLAALPPDTRIVLYWC